MRLPQRIHGKRITLALPGPGDAADLYGLLEDEVIEHTNIPKPKGPEDTAGWIADVRERFRAGTDASYVIHAERPIGVASLLNIGNGRADIGTWLGRAYWGNGYAQEALELVIGEAFRRLRLTHIVASAKEENIRSQELIKRLGFTYHSEGSGYRHFVLLREDLA